MTKLKDIPGFEGLYAASKDGHIWSYYKNDWKIERLNKSGYNCISANVKGKDKDISVHTLIAKTYIGDIPEGYCVNHKDECKTNNAVDNLEIVTKAYNTTYGTACERRGLSNRKGIILTNCKTQKIKEFDSGFEASFHFGYKHSNAINTLIHKAKKKGLNYITINGEDYNFKVYKQSKNHDTKIA